MLFSYADLDEALRLLISELVADGAPARIGVVGAAAVALQVGRQALTQDVDALHADWEINYSIATTRPG